jgi:hypothetical protein
MCAQAYLLHAGILGYSAQINSGLSTPTSILGSLSAVAPIGVLAVCAMWQPGSINRSALGALVVGETALLVATGFRGAAPTFVAALIIVVVVTRAENLRAMGSGKLAAIAAGLAIAAIGTFTAAAFLKDAAAMSKWGRTDAPIVWTADEFLPQLGQRLDLGPPFKMSLAYSGAVEEPGVFSWSNQSVALFPRIFWRDKPIVGYPQFVTSEIYGLRDVQSSSTISTLGDVNLNSGPYGTLIIGILIGIGLNLIEQHIRSGRSRPIGYIAFAIILPVLIDQETPLGLKLADLLQPLVVLLLLWRVAVIVSVHSSRRGASRMRLSNLEQGALT